jgi:hypothetical protein
VRSRIWWISPLWTKYINAGLSILGLYFDIIYVSEVSEWTPTGWYSLMLFTPIVGVDIGFHYLYKRSAYVGLWSVPPRAGG